DLAWAKIEADAFERLNLAEGLDDVAQRNQRRRPQAACPIQARSSGWRHERCSDPLLIRQAHLPMPSACWRARFHARLHWGGLSGVKIFPLSSKVNQLLSMSDK